MMKTENVSEMLNYCSKLMQMVTAEDFIISRHNGSSMLGVPSHHSMVGPHIADGGDNHQIWRVAMKILNKQLHTADKGYTYSLGDWA
jgi:hypothetical protein